MLRLFFLLVCTLSLLYTCSATPSKFSTIDAHNIDDYWLELGSNNNNNNNNVAVAAPMAGVYGVDISQEFSESQFSCLKNNGHSFVVVRAWQSNCEFDSGAVNSIHNAWAAGMSHVDVYLFPSYGCSHSAAQQVDMTLDGLQRSGSRFGMLWFDIEASGSGWSGDHNANHAWLSEAVKEAQARGIKVGIYSSEYGWSVPMGSLGGFSDLPLWYAHYDNNPSFGDFRGFAGWSHPAVKQYAGTTSMCGGGVDLNWYPA